MILERPDDGFEIHREDKMLYIRFLTPHRLISTCRIAGGIREDLEFVVNNQSCEPINHDLPALNRAWQDPDDYHRFVCQRFGLSTPKCAALGTAANMNQAAVVVKRFQTLTVAAIVTGGVETNAGRVGDPASVFEVDGEFETLIPPEPPPAGTINIILVINKELTSGALVRTIVTATEAKTAALQELAVNSRYSEGLATGTGTDQIAVACRLNTGVPLTGAGKHVKLGELIGLAVMSAVKATLARQNGLTPVGQCSVRIHLERFRAKPGKLEKHHMIDGVCRFLDPTTADLLEDNYDVVDEDPPTAAAAAAMAHIMDKLSWGVLPNSCRQEILINQACLLAAAVSGLFEKTTEYRKRLSEYYSKIERPSVLDLAQFSLAMGFQDKWKHLERPLD